MPSGLFSHQAPGLILKLKYPKKFDGTALCIGTIIPDINVLFNPFLRFNFRHFTHSLLGLIILGIPLAIFLTIIFSRSFGPFLAKIAKRKSAIYKPMRYIGMDKLGFLQKKKIDKRFFLVSFYSAFIGGITHLLLDLPSHEEIELFFPIIMQTPELLRYLIIDYGTVSFGQIELNGDIRVYDLIWLFETVVLFIIAIFLLRYIKKRDLIHKWYEEI